MLPLVIHAQTVNVPIVFHILQQEHEISVSNEKILSRLAETWQHT